ncbi:hypothetical protein [Rurimicrobium arvi]
MSICPFRFLKILFAAALFIVVTAAFVSCGNCSGCDYIYETNGAAFDITDTTIDLKDPYALAEIRLERIVSEKKGTRHCRYKNEVNCLEDQLDSNRLVLYCTSDLALREGFIAAGTNLLREEFVLRRDNMNGVSVPAVFLQASDSFPEGRYTFIVKGSTQNGKPVEDIGFINWSR